MVCDFIETGPGLTCTTLLLNKKLYVENKEEVGIRCVRELDLLLEPDTILIRKVAIDICKNDTHSLASLSLLKQLSLAQLFL